MIRSASSERIKALNRCEQSQTGPRCVVHGDCHLGNSYRRADGERIWLDWQLVRKGRPWRDLTYFMIGSLTIEERRQSERALHQTLPRRVDRDGRAGRRRTSMRSSSTTAAGSSTVSRPGLPTWTIGAKTDCR